MEKQNIITPGKVMARVTQLIVEAKRGVVVNPNGNRHVPSSGFYIQASREVTPEGKETNTLYGINKQGDIAAEVRYSFEPGREEFLIRPDAIKQPGVMMDPNHCDMPTLRRVARLVGIKSK